MTQGGGGASDVSRRDVQRGRVHASWRRPRAGPERAAACVGSPAQCARRERAAALGVRGGDPPASLWLGMFSSVGKRTPNSVSSNMRDLEVGSQMLKLSVSSEND